MAFGPQHRLPDRALTIWALVVAHPSSRISEFFNAKSVCTRLAKRQSLRPEEQIRSSACHATSRQTESPQFIPAQQLRSPARTALAEPPATKRGLMQLRCAGPSPRGDET